jgi:mannose-6-phosphate isomerase-like protein (cupin superfamily)
MPRATSPQQIAASLTELWSPRVIGEVDDAYVKVAKVHGTLGWHAHEGEDEMFFVLKGRLRIELDRQGGGDFVELGEGEMFVVPKGVRHNPVAEQECQLLLIERKSTLHTGDVVTDKTRSIDEQLRPL